MVGAGVERFESVAYDETQAFRLRLLIAAEHLPVP